jgi:protein-tyrosine phosphatase
MAEGLLRFALKERGLGDDVHVHSAGLLPGGMPATDHARVVVPNIDDHQSRQLTADLVAGADLVLGMTGEHLREAAVLHPPAFFRTFTLKELVRRGSAIGPRHPGEKVVDWLGRASVGRSVTSVLSLPSSEDVADPIGRPLQAYRATAVELADLLERLVALVWPDGTGPD